MELEAQSLRETISADLVKIAPATAAAEPLARYAELVAEWARRMNLTGFRDPLEIARRLILPPLIWSRLLPCVPATIADLGSGAGFPGIPLALGFERARVHLIEARERRHHFQRHVVRELGLSRVVPLHGRAEDLPPVECEVGVAQGFLPLPRAVFHVKRWTKIDGVIGIPQSTARPALQDPDLEWLGCPAYIDPFAGRRSFLWMSRRKS